MKSLYLTKNQASSLAQDLLEYSHMKDSSERELFTGFHVQFGDLQAQEPTSGDISMTPIPSFTSIDNMGDE